MASRVVANVPNSCPLGLDMAIPVPDLATQCTIGEHVWRLSGALAEAGSDRRQNTGRLGGLTPHAC